MNDGRQWMHRVTIFSLYISNFFIYRLISKYDEYFKEISLLFKKELKIIDNFYFK